MKKCEIHFTEYEKYCKGCRRDYMRERREKKKDLIEKKDTIPVHDSGIADFTILLT